MVEIVSAVLLLLTCLLHLLSDLQSQRRVQSRSNVCPWRKAAWMVVCCFSILRSEPASRGHRFAVNLSTVAVACKWRCVCRGVSMGAPSSKSTATTSPKTNMAKRETKNVAGSVLWDWYVLIRLKDASDDAPSKKEISHAQVRLLQQVTLKQFNVTFLTRAKSQINALKILSEPLTPHGGTKKRKKPSVHKHTMPDIKTFERNWPAQPNQESSPFAFLLLHSLTPELMDDGLRECYMAILKF